MISSGGVTTGGVDSVVVCVGTVGIVVSGLSGFFVTDGTVAGGLGCFFGREGVFCRFRGCACRGALMTAVFRLSVNGAGAKCQYHGNCQQSRKIFFHIGHLDFTDGII